MVSYDSLIPAALMCTENCDYLGYRLERSGEITRDGKSFSNVEFGLRIAESSFTNFIQNAIKTENSRLCVFCDTEFNLDHGIGSYLLRDKDSRKFIMYVVDGYVIKIYSVCGSYVLRFIDIKTGKFKFAGYMAANNVFRIPTIYNKYAGEISSLIQELLECPLNHMMIALSLCCASISCSWLKFDNGKYSSIKSLVFSEDTCFSYCKDFRTLCTNCEMEITDGMHDFDKDKMRVYQSPGLTGDTDFGRKLGLTVQGVEDTSKEYRYHGTFGKYGSFIVMRQDTDITIRITGAGWYVVTFRLNAEPVILSDDRNDKLSLLMNTFKS